MCVCAGVRERECVSGSVSERDCGSTSSIIIEYHVLSFLSSFPLTITNINLISIIVWWSSKRW